MRVLVTGAGSIGTRHALNLHALGHDVVVHDVRAQAAEALAARVGGVPVASIDASDADAVVVATPPAMHAEAVQHAATLGAKMLLEKPIAHTVEDARRICLLADEHDMELMIACNMRFHAGPATLMAAVRAGDIGRPLAARFHTGSYLPAWRPGTDYKTGVSADMQQGGAVRECIHELDLAQALLGPAEVRGAACVTDAGLDVPVVALAEALLDHSGVPSTVHMNFAQRDTMRNILVIGTEGTIRWDLTANDVRLLGPDSRVISGGEDADLNTMYVRELERFLSDQPLVNGPAEATATLEMAMHIMEQG